MSVEMVTNPAGRRVPAVVNGKEQVPFQGVGKYRPEGRKQAPPIRSSADYPESGDKRVPDLETALGKCGLSDGMTLSGHHHLRNGDAVALQALQAAARLGVKDLTWFPSASFPCHAPVIDLMEAGVVHHIEGSMNGPLDDYCSQRKMRGLGVLRSHGGRWQAIQDGEVHIDVAVIAGPTADPFGNADGSHGPSACGSLGFALADVDYLVEVEAIGDPSKIVSGTIRIEWVRHPASSAGAMPGASCSPWSYVERRSIAFFRTSAVTASSSSQRYSVFLACQSRLFS